MSDMFKEPDTEPLPAPAQDSDKPAACPPAWPFGANARSSRAGQGAAPQQKRNQPKSQFRSEK